MIDLAGGSIATQFPTLKYGTEGNLYIPREKVELFPELPFLATVGCDVLNIRDKPGTAGAIGGQYQPGAVFWISEYKPLGASVWGKTERGWVCLLEPQDLAAELEYRMRRLGAALHTLEDFFSHSNFPSNLHQNLDNNNSFINNSFSFESRLAVSGVPGTVTTTTSDCSSSSGR